LDDWRHGGFGVYVHWPFCAAKCPYCDFNSHVAATVDQDRWRRALLAEIDRLAAETPGRVVDSVFFGGGTPSLMDPSVTAAVIARIGARWQMAADVEITLEANPGSVEAGRFRDYIGAGVNRLSLGVQALDDADLKRLGRIHDVAEARRAIAIAQSVCERVSLDLIYARQDQTPEAWAAELRAALRLSQGHLSLYQLTIEDGTTFAKRARAGQLPGLPDEDRGTDMYLITNEICDEAGLPAYEISNHAAPGQECRHNMIYWRYGDYAGIGPGAHGRLTLGGQRHATAGHRAPALWLQAVEEQGSGEVSRETLRRAEEAEEYLLMALRTREGLDPDRYAALAGHPLPRARIDDLSEFGLLEMHDGRLRATRDGRLLLNRLIVELSETP